MSRVIEFPAGTSQEEIQRFLVQNGIRGGAMPANFYHWPCKDQICPDCQEQWMSDSDQQHPQRLYSKSLSEAQASLTVRKLARSIAANRRRLQDQLAKHGDLFMGRWKKRSRDKREDVLRRANPNIPDDALAYYELTQPNGNIYDWSQSRTPKFRQAMLLPYLNITALRDNPACIFALLHYRSDAWKIGLVEVEFAKECVVMHGERYGDLVPFNATNAHRGDIVGYPRARLILEAQARLLDFLSNVLDITLEGANLDTHASEKWSAMCQEGFKTPGDLAQWSTYIYQPFSAPPTLDLATLLATAQSRFNATADHLTMLQTDPAYMRRYIRLSTQGQLSKQSQSSDPLATVDASITLDLASLYWWLCIIEEVEHVRDVFDKVGHRVERGRPLPEVYDTALASLELVLVNQMNVRGELFRTEISQRPGFAKYFTVRGSGNGRFTIAKNFDGHVSLKYHDDPLFWCLVNLCGRPDDQATFNHAHMFAFLETHLAKSSTKERARVDQIIVDQLSDHAAVHQMLLAVRLSRPQNRAGDSVDMAMTEKRRAWKNGEYGVLEAGIVGGSPSARGLLLQRFSQSNTPSAKNDSTWIEQHTKMHDALGSYWSAVRQNAPGHTNDPALSKYLEADRSPEHIAALQAERQAVANKLAQQSNDLDQQSVASRAVDPSPETTKLEPRPEKTKKKTRPALSEVTVNQAEQASDDNRKQLIADEAETAISASEFEQVATTKRAVDLFSKVYPEDAAASTQGADWDSFVLAMKDVGFSVQNGAGSAVTFDLSSKGKIVFHRPHPSPKIDHIMLRVFGKRLTKWFGWSRESFVLA